MAQVEQIKQGCSQHGSDGAKAAVAGATGEAAGGGAAAAVEQLGTPLPKGKVAADSGPGQVPGQSPGQAPGKAHGKVGGKRGKGHHFAPGKGHAKHGHVVQQLPAAQVAGLAGSSLVQKPVTQKPVDKPVTQVAGDSGDTVAQQPVAQKGADKPITQVAGDSGDAVAQQPVAQKGADKPVTQVAGDSGDAVAQQPVAQKPVDKPVTQVAGDSGDAVAQQPVAQKGADKPATQVAGDSGDAVAQQPVAQQPVQQEPFMGTDVRLLEVEGSGMQLFAKDNSRLDFHGSSVGFTSSSNQYVTFQLPPEGVSLTLSDGVKFSLALTASGQPRDIEIVAPDGGFVAARSGDNQATDMAQTPLTPAHLIEITSMLANKEYTSFGGSDGKVVQQS